MTNVTRRIMNEFVALFALLFSVQAPLTPVSEWSRLRVTDSRTAHYLREGVARSAILRDLVATVEDGDVLVYVGSDSHMPGRQTGRMMLLGVLDNYRYVRVWIRGGLVPDQFIAALAHELQHVTEVVAHPEVQDATTLVGLYRRIGNERQARGRTSFETPAARKVTIDVRRELAAGGR